MYLQEEEGGLGALAVERILALHQLSDKDDFEMHYDTVPMKWNVNVIVRQCSVVWALE